MVSTKSILLTVTFALMLCGLTGCSDSPPGKATAKPESAGALVQDDFLQTDENMTAEDRRFLEAGKPFVVALAAGRYQDAYAMLSSHARQSMHPDQFLTPTDDAARSAPTPPFENLSAPQFAEQMQQVVKRYGPPRAPQRLYVQSTDRELLAGRGDAMDRMFAIGNMPPSVPTDIRRASLRGSVATKLTPEDIKKLAEEYDMTPEEIAKDDEFQPYYNIKFVLVEDEGTLKVGYFEIMPPSMLD